MRTMILANCCGELPVRLQARPDLVSSVLTERDGGCCAHLTVEEKEAARGEGHVLSER